jgi:RHH-type transcriptional regulator, rel operon repressor / antitoxin RelB
MNTLATAPLAPTMGAMKLPPALGESLASWNASSGRDQTPALMEAMTEFVARESAITARIKKSIAQADAGQYASAERVASVFAKYER